MKSKLTLRIEEELIEKIKKFSKEKGYSVSKLVESYFKSLTGEEKEELTPTVKKLKGLLKNKNVKEEDYKKHLQDKYF
jgi:hypothetical protein